MGRSGTGRDSASEVGLPPAHLTYSIGEAAAQLGTSPARLRAYERDGLVRFARSAGGHRRITAEQLRYLQRASHSRPGGDPSAAVSPPPPDGQDGNGRGLGPRLRALRHRAGLTLKAAAERTGLSFSFISAVERGQTGISLMALQRIVVAYGANFTALLDPRSSEGTKLVRSRERRRLPVGEGLVSVEELVRSSSRLEVQLWTIAPGAGSTDAYTHGGEEFLFLVSGSFDVWVGTDGPFHMEPGDCLHFESNVPHRWLNSGKQEAVVLWTNTSPMG